MSWRYQFQASPPSMMLGKPPDECLPGEWPVVAGVDGRWPSGCRRYPGHVAYPTTSLTPGTAVPIHRIVPVQFQKQVDSDVRIMGWVVHDNTGGAIRLWYRLSTGSADLTSFTLRTGITSGTKWWATTRGRFLYLTVQNSSNENTVHYWEPHYSQFVSRFTGANDSTGASLSYAAPTLTESASGYLGAGTYAVAYRYRDTNRSRYSPLSAIGYFTPTAAGKKCGVGTASSGDNAHRIGLSSGVVPAGYVETTTTVKLASGEPSTDDALNGLVLLVTNAGTPSWRYITDYDGATRVATVHSSFGFTPADGDAYAVYEAVFNRVQIFAAVGSEYDATLAAYPQGGGQLYLIGETSLGADGGFGFTFGTSTDTDNGYGVATSTMIDADFVLRYPYDLTYDPQVNIADVDCCGIAHFGGVTYIARTASQAFVDLVWSSTTRLEPENFPTANEYPTRIPVEASRSVRFIQGSDYLYLQGGSYLYRIQRTGTSVLVTRVADTMGFLNAEATCVVGNTVFFVTSTGIYTMDARSGSISELLPAAWWLQNRWATACNSVMATTGGLFTAYDARMNCLYVLNPALSECLCLWLGSGRVTLLVGANFDVVSSQVHMAPDAAGTSFDTAERAFFFTGYSQAVYPNWNTRWTTTSAGSRTMHGVELATSGGSLNPVVQSVTRGGSTTTLTFASNHFTGKVMAGSLVRPLAGVNRNRFWLVTGNTNNTLTLDGVWASDASGEDGHISVALSPVVMQLVGAPLDVGGRPDLTVRKKITNVSLVGGTAASLGDNASTNPASGQASETTYGYGLFRAGAVRPSDMDSWNNGTHDIVRPVHDASGPITYATGKVGAAWGASHEGTGNNVRLNAAFSALLPSLTMIVSNLDIPLQEWMIHGGWEATAASQVPL